MRICHLLSENINVSKGTPIAVRNLRQNHDVMSLKSSGLPLYFKSFLAALQLVFSKYDIIHTHDMAGYGYTFIPKSLRKKTLYSCHGLWKTYFEGRKLSLSERIMAPLLIRAQSRIIKNSDIVVATARFRQKEIKSTYGVDAELAHNGIDTNLFRPRKTKKLYDFIWVGTNSAKGLKEAKKYAADMGGKLLVVGVEGKNGKNITYMPSVPNNEMPQMYNQSKTLINFSTISIYDFVVLEAMASGINVMINKEAAEELMPGKKFSGTVFIGGAEGRRTVSKYSWKNAIEKYNKLYSKLL
jgi:glycosyltransferase involved in cell wall biosynthesis